MPTILKSETFTARNVGRTGYYNYKIEIILNSQDAVLHKSNITIKTYQNRGTSGYDGNGYIKFSLWGHTSKSPTDAEWVAPIKVTRNMVNAPGWELIEDLTYTADFEHKADSQYSLAVRAKVKLDNTGSTNQYAPVDTEMECVATVPSLTPGSTWTALDPPEDWLLASTDSVDGYTPMRFTFTPAANAKKHKITVTTNGCAGDHSIVDNRNAGTWYTSGTKIEITNTRLLWILDEMGAADSTELVATATLESYDNSETLLGSDAKTFKIIGSGADAKVGNEWKNGIMWVKVGDIWKPGIVWVKDGNTWKKGIGLSNE